MPETITIASPSTKSKVRVKKPTKEQSVFVLRTFNGTYIIGQATNVCKRISSINSGNSPYFPQALQVEKIVGIKPVSEDRDLLSVALHFIRQAGEENVVVV